jgi:hypothetical protein
MVSQFTPVPPGWKVLFEQQGKAKIWLPLLGWLQGPGQGIQPCVWWAGVTAAATVAGELGVDEWSVVEQDFSE